MLFDPIGSAGDGLLLLLGAVGREDAVRLLLLEGAGLLVQLRELLPEDQADAGVVAHLRPVLLVDRLVVVAGEVGALQLPVGLPADVRHAQTGLGRGADGLDDLVRHLGLELLALDLADGDEDADEDGAGRALLGGGVGRALRLARRVQGDLLVQLDDLAH